MRRGRAVVTAIVFPASTALPHFSALPHPSTSTVFQRSRHITQQMTRSPTPATQPSGPAQPSESEQVDALRKELASLRLELAREKKRRLAAEDAARELRRETTLNQIRLEEEEEMISNKLMKRLSELKHEKEQIARASESDSEWVTNSLSQRLEELQRQKHRIIAAAEEENEFIVNRLNKELDALRMEKLELERKVQRLSRSTTPGAVTPTSSPALSLRSTEGSLSRNGSYRLPGSSAASASTPVATPTNPNLHPPEDN